MNNKSKPVYCIELNREFPSINSCAKQLGISNANLRKVLMGTRHKCSGYHFKFVNGGPEDGNEQDKIPPTNL